jgi:RNA polymerase sigma-70 factor (ECF subfamily)
MERAALPCLTVVDVEPSGASAADELDERDVAAARRGDEQAFERLVKRHQRAVARLLWRFTRDHEDHAELVGDVFVAAYSALSHWRGKGTFERWLRAIAVRGGYSYWRRRGRDRARIEFSADVGELLDERGEERSSESAVAAAELVHGLLAKLSERDRVVVTLLHLEGLSVAEVAEATGWSQSMVKVQAFRARGRLKKLLEEGS